MAHGLATPRYGISLTIYLIHQIENRQYLSKTSLPNLTPNAKFPTVWYADTFEYAPVMKESNVEHYACPKTNKMRKNIT